MTTEQESPIITKKRKVEVEESDKLPIIEKMDALDENRTKQVDEVDGVEEGNDVHLEKETTIKSKSKPTLVRLKHVKKSNKKSNKKSSKETKTKKPKGINLEAEGSDEEDPNEDEEKLNHRLQRVLEDLKEAPERELLTEKIQSKNGEKTRMSRLKLSKEDIELKSFEIRRNIRGHKEWMGSDDDISEDEETDEEADEEDDEDEDEEEEEEEDDEDEDEEEEEEHDETQEVDQNSSPDVIPPPPSTAEIKKKSHGNGNPYLISSKLLKRIQKESEKYGHGFEDVPSVDPFRRVTRSQRQQSINMSSVPPASEITRGQTPSSV